MRGRDESDNDVVNAYSLALAREGFTKREEDYYTITLSEDVLGWVGLDRARRGPRRAVLEIDIGVGLRNQPLEQLVAELKEVEYHDYFPPSIGMNIGYLMPKQIYTPWLFDNQTDIAAAVLQGMADLRKYAFPFMRSNIQLKKLLNTLWKCEHVGWDYCIPAALYLLKDYRKIPRFLAEEITRREYWTERVDQPYRDFASRLLQRLPK